MRLPERRWPRQEGRSYDYRYVWIRDQSYIGQAIGAAGPHPLLRLLGLVSSRRGCSRTVPG